jgi:hypothetical protein
MEHTLLVTSNGRDVARCVPMINRRWQREGREDTGFIGYFAAAPDADAPVARMLEAAERWLAERGVKRVIAPFSGDAFHGFATHRRLRRTTDVPAAVAAALLPRLVRGRRLRAGLSLLDLRRRLHL